MTHEPGLGSEENSQSIDGAFADKRAILKEKIALLAPQIEIVLRAAAKRYHQKGGDVYSQRYCLEVVEGLGRKQLEDAKIEPADFLITLEDGRSDIHSAFFHRATEIVVDCTSGQYFDASGRGLSEMIKRFPELYVGRVLVATPQEIQKKIGITYQIIEHERNESAKSAFR